jgi:hypothetical protein
MISRLTTLALILSAVSGPSSSHALAMDLSLNVDAKKADATCVYPDPQKLLGPNFPVNYEKADYLLFDTPTGRIRWLFVSYEGPKDGVLFVLSCNGQVITSRGVGWIDKLDFGPTVNGQTTVEAVYVTASGTGLYVEGVSLFTLDGKSVRDLWDHESYDMGSFPPSLWSRDPRETRWRTEIETYEWKYVPIRSANKSEIAVTGTHEIDYDDKARVKPTKPEKYCYRTDKNKFVRC